MMMIWLAMNATFVSKVQSSIASKSINPFNDIT